MSQASAATSRIRDLAAPRKPDQSSPRPSRSVSEPGSVGAGQHPARGDPAGQHDGQLLGERAQGLGQRTGHVTTSERSHDQPVGDTTERGDHGRVLVESDGQDRHPGGEGSGRPQRDPRAKPVAAGAWVDPRPRHPAVRRRERRRRAAASCAPSAPSGPSAPRRPARRVRPARETQGRPPPTPRRAGSRGRRGRRESGCASRRSAPRARGGPTAGRGGTPTPPGCRCPARPRSRPPSRPRTRPPPHRRGRTAERR